MTKAEILERLLVVEERLAELEALVAVQRDAITQLEDELSQSRRETWLFDESPSTSDRDEEDDW